MEFDTEKIFTSSMSNMGYKKGLRALGEIMERIVVDDTGLEPVTPAL